MNNIFEFSPRAFRSVWLRWLALGLMLGVGGVNPVRAQSGGTKPPARASAAAAGSETVKEPSEKGMHSGIKVHGHWTIETRNPDGSRDKHVEFENSLQGADGGNLLTGLLSGNYTSGGLRIQIYGPCSTANGLCAMTAPGSAVTANVNCPTTPAAASPQPYCYATLTESLTGAGSGVPFSTFTLSGQAYADTTTAITEVQTLGAYCGGSGGTPYPFASEAPNSCFKDANQQSQALTSTPLVAPPNCGGASQAPCQVQVVAGQTVAATVVISFQ